MDYYGDKQPTRVYPFFKSQGSRAAPVTGQTVERQSMHTNVFNGIPANSGGIYDTMFDTASVNGGFNLGKLSGAGAGDDFVIDFEQVSIVVAENPIVFPVTLQITSITAAVQNANNSPATILWQSAPYSGVISGNPEMAADFAPQMKPMRWDAYQFVDLRTQHLQNVWLSFRITMSNSATTAVNVNATSVIRYTVQNLNAVALPTPVQF